MATSRNKEPPVTVSTATKKSIFRNYSEFDASLLPIQVKNAIQPCMFKNHLVHVLMSVHCTDELYLWASNIERVPLITIWDLYTKDDVMVGHLFQSSGQMVTASSNHLLVQSPSLTRQFSVDDSLAEGKVTRIASVPNFNVFHMDLGATLIAQKSLNFMSKVLDKEAK